MTASTRSGRRGWSAGVAPGVQRELLPHRRQPERGGLGAELRLHELVLDLEDRLPRGDEGRERRALAVLRALLVDREVERRDELRDLVEVVLQADAQPAAVGLLVEPLVERQLVGGRQLE